MEYMLKEAKAKNPTPEATVDCACIKHLFILLVLFLWSTD